MKRVKNCFDKVYTDHNLFAAYRLARQGKGDRLEISQFEFDLEFELYSLQKVLENRDYHHGEYRHRTIYERKPRLISAAPFRDRVVHHALMAVIEPLIDTKMISGSYACRPGKGVHKAVNHYQKFAGRYAYVMKLDIASYFASIDHVTLIRQLEQRIADLGILWLFSEIITSYQFSAGKGLPIGNLTSQFLANYYLNDFDHWIKHSLRVPGYLRYVDDFFLFSDDKQQLWRWTEDIKTYLTSLQLKPHANKIHLCRAAERIDVLGYTVTPERRWLRNDNGHRFVRRLRKLAKARQLGWISLDQLHSHVRSWIGHAQHGETYRLREEIFANQLI